MPADGESSNEEKLSAEEIAPEEGSGWASCGAQNVPGAKFCSNCGEKLKKAVICPKCGFSQQGVMKFCPNCGTKVAS